MWKKQFSGLDLCELQWLRQVRDENEKLNQFVAELTLDMAALREALGDNW